MNDLAIENNLQNEIVQDNEQKNFLETNIGKAVNTGLDIGLRYLLPDLIEDDIIKIKDSIFEGGIKEGVQTAVDSAINLGKSIVGLFTGKFESVNQMQTAVKTGGIIDSVSAVVDSTINKVVDSGKLSYSVGNTIKKGKNVLLNNISRNIESEFENQVNNIEKLDKYIENWKDYFNNKDFDGMQREYDKIHSKLKEVAPIEKAIKTGRTIENLHTLIKNNGKNFDLTEEELELAKML